MYGFRARMSLRFVGRSTTNVEYEDLYSNQYEVVTPDVLETDGITKRPFRLLNAKYSFCGLLSFHLINCTDETVKWLKFTIYPTYT